MNLKALGLLASCASLLFACSSGDLSEDGDEVSSADAISADLTAGTFKLYPEPSAIPNTSCDKFTRLELKEEGALSKAHLEEVVGGRCDMFFVPNPRDYRLRLTSTECGSRYYEGSFRKNGQRHAIKIADHRTRECDGRLIANVIVDEELPGAAKATLYSAFEDAFCPTAFCSPGSQCNEQTRRCEELAPFCPTALCSPGSQCNESQRRCVAAE